MKLSVLIFSVCLLGVTPANARECQMPLEWNELCHILESRVKQKKPKMKLKEADAKELERFLNTSQSELKELNALQSQLPKTTLELLFSICKRGVDPKEADQMAFYLSNLTRSFQFSDIGAFDENTSHIIGREWDEIDYSNEGMSSAGQRKKYAPYGIRDFKSKDQLSKFFKVESQLPYFSKIYKPRGFNLTDTRSIAISKG